MPILLYHLSNSPVAPKRFFGSGCANATYATRRQAERLTRQESPANTERQLPRRRGINNTMIDQNVKKRKKKRAAILNPNTNEAYSP